MERQKRKKPKTRPFLSGDPGKDYRGRQHIPPLVRTAEEAVRTNEFYERLSKNYDEVYTHGAPRYQDCVRFERKNPGKHWDSDMLSFSEFVNEWRKKRGIPRREEDWDGYLQGLTRAYPGPALPVFIW